MIRFSFAVLTALSLISSITSIPLSSIPSLYDYCRFHHCKQPSTNYSPSDLLNRHIKLYHGSIIDLEVDAIVNAANSQLRRGGGVCGVIHSAAGPELEHASVPKGPIRPGLTVVTSAFNLQPDINYVFHTVGPDMRRPDEKQNGDNLLKSAYESALSQLENLQLSSIAFPCLSSGIYGFDRNKAANIALATVRRWMDLQLHKKTRLPIIVFVTFDQKDSKIYKSKLTHYFPLTPSNHRNRNHNDRHHNHHRRRRRQMKIRREQNHKVSLKLYLGSLLDNNVGTDVLVNSVNSAMSSNQGLSRLVFQSAGPQLNKLLKGKSYKFGTVVVTAPFKLAHLCRYLFHAVISPLPRFAVDKYIAISKIYWSILDEARRLQVTSIAIPSLGTGVSHGMQIQESAPIVIQAVKQWIPMNCRSSISCRLKTIKFVLITPQDYQVYRQALQQLS